MEIILKEDIHGLGFKDDVVSVKKGYANNYLIPYGKAILATASAKKSLAENLKQRAHKLAKIKADAEQLAADIKAKLEANPLSITTKVSTTGSIYGSITPLQIADELQKLGFTIDRKAIKVDDVKEIGSYNAVARLHKEVSVDIPFEVVSE